jgi:hypothetical protein
MPPRFDGPVAACSGRVEQVEDSSTLLSMTFGFIEDEVFGPAEKASASVLVDSMVGGGHG